MTQRSGPAFIYALAGPDGIRYVGMTCCPTNRFRQHGSGKDDSTGCWVRRVGHAIRVLILDVVDHDSRYQVEAKWIRHVRDLGAALLNKGGNVPMHIQIGVQGWVNDAGLGEVSRDLQICSAQVMRYMGGVAKPLPDRLRRIEAKLAERAKGEKA